MKKLADNVFWVGATDWKVRYFHGYELSTHRGTSYNAYLIKDEKTVLIDTVWEPLTDRFMENLKEVVDICSIDYVVVNHAEPDHSGALPVIMEYIPDATVIVSKKGEESVKKYYQKDWNFKVVSTGDKINIGKNDLIFIEASMLHWPDSMFTYLTGENILFSNDAFGQHYASSKLFNDEADKAEVYQEALKYYANILTPFSKLVIKKIEEIKKLNLPVTMIAPSHGIIWRQNPLQIIEHYERWAKGETENSVVIIYNSMWGATHKMAEMIGKGIDFEGIKYKIFNSATADKNDILAEVFKSKGVILGSSTVNNGILASLTPIVDEIMGLQFKSKVGAAFGSYGWSGESPKLLEEHLKKCDIEVIQEAIKVKYMPTEEECEACIEFGRSFAQKMVSKA